MKNSILKKIVLVGLLTLVMCSAFLAPTTVAQTYSYNGVDTQSIPYHNVYPSEWYVYDWTMDDDQLVWEISHGNVTDLGSGDTTAVWYTRYFRNTTTGQLTFTMTGVLSSWDDIIGYEGDLVIAPVESNGTLSQSIMDSVKDHYESQFTPNSWQYYQAFTNPYSFKFWNTTGQKVHLIVNYSSDGVLTAYNWYYPPVDIPNMTLVSRPAQLPPDFSFMPETGSLDIDTSTVKLNVTITPADNNNDFEIDTDYLYRVMVGTNWTSWSAVPPQIDYDLSGVPSGTHQITLEVKNMYGTTQEQITIQFTPPSSPAIPGYSTLIITVVMLIGLSFVMRRVRRN